MGIIRDLLCPDVLEDNSIVHIRLPYHTLEWKFDIMFISSCDAIIFTQFHMVDFLVRLKVNLHWPKVNAKVDFSLTFFNAEREH